MWKGDKNAKLVASGKNKIKPTIINHRFYCTFTSVSSSSSLSFS